MTAPTPATPDGYPRRWGEYLLLERLGAGGMSEVDLARKFVDDGAFVRFTVIKRIKADKTLDESFVRMFKDEARITSELHHAKIGAVYDFGRVGDEWFLALEYVPGVDVRYLVNVLRERGQRLPARVALRICADVLDALEYAHTKKDTLGRKMGIVHRDVNPRNVMVSIRGDVKLIDFGVAKATDRLERTRTDHVKGKFSYMAPEQISGLPVDHRADVYALGLMLHELLAGVSPFHGLNQVQILHRMLSGKAPPLPALPEVKDPAALEAIHRRALAQSPADRYPTAAAMAEELRAFASTIGGLPGPDQLAAFLTSVDPALTARLQSKMEAYARPSTEQSGASPMPGEPPVDPAALREAMLPESGSIVGPAAGEADPYTVTRIGVVGGSLVLVAMASAALAALVVALVLVAALLWLRPDLAEPSTPPAPAPVERAEEPAAPRPERTPPAAPSGVAPEPEVRPAPRPAPSAPAPSAPVPAAPAPSGLGPAEPVAAPEPAPPVEPIAPAPSEPPAAPLPVDSGFLNVLSDPRGSPVRVDGAEVGRTPLERYKLPVGPHTVEVPGLTCSPRAVTIRKSVVVSVSCK